MPLITLAGVIAVVSLGWVALHWFTRNMGGHPPRYTASDLPRLCAGPVLSVVLAAIGWRITPKREDSSWTIWPAFVIFLNVIALGLAVVVVVT